MRNGLAALLLLCSGCVGQVSENTAGRQDAAYFPEQELLPALQVKDSVAYRASFSVDFSPYMYMEHPIQPDGTSVLGLEYFERGRQFFPERMP